MAELAACYAGTQTIVADTNRFVLEGVSEVVMALGHGSNKDTNAFLWPQCFKIVLTPNDGGFETHRDFAAVRREMIRDRVFNNS